MEFREIKIYFESYTQYPWEWIVVRIYADNSFYLQAKKPRKSDSGIIQVKEKLSTDYLSLDFSPVDFWNIYLSNTPRGTQYKRFDDIAERHKILNHSKLDMELISIITRIRH